MIAATLKLTQLITLGVAFDRMTVHKTKGGLVYEQERK